MINLYNFYDDTTRIIVECEIQKNFISLLNSNHSKDNFKFEEARDDN